MLFTKIHVVDDARLLVESNIFALQSYPRNGGFQVWEVFIQRPGLLILPQRGVTFVLEL